MQNDREIVLKAIQNKGLALQFASEELKNDLEIVLIAIKSNISALKFASNGLKNNRLVLFDPLLWHSHGNNFGNCLENSRVVMVFFFTKSK